MSDDELSVAQLAALHVLRDHPGVTTSAAAIHLDISFNHALIVLNTLYDRGLAGRLPSRDLRTGWTWHPLHPDPVKVDREARQQADR